ncbi:hypothetical protein G3O00_01500 [Burkholderia sp. Ac-20384]|uniref:hypothetical protein n=1 Tax=Burkholderia sp. Ac-20384 TaxID=2703902 RepID=UPI00197F65E9|nr:hypothetical protein [Burkholderia sp. Ac-20384]MBN3822293.1 hypothetical protein [Burkholderia sp. Ac-20384]
MNKTLTDKHRSLIEHAEERLRGRGPEDVEAANGLLEVLTAHPGQPEPFTLASALEWAGVSDAYRKDPEVEATRATRAYPDELTDDLRHVLGFPNFRCGPYAHLMRAAGADIKTKAEDEQAYVLHWLVKMVLDHGARWADVAGDELEAIRAKVDGARAGDAPC